MMSPLDKVMSNMSLEEEEEPFVLPELPEFYYTERNTLSMVGRLLNPQCHKMSDLIVDMPRRWQLYDRVKGVALSKDRFQFIFKHEHDLLGILNRGVHTHNMWPIVLERWVAKPPHDFLQYIYVWVQMRNIPVNHYTKNTITSLRDFAGKVEVVAFVPEKTQTMDYARVHVKFYVSTPLRRSKKLTLPGGEEVNILYDYERLQKRCYTCQHLTREQSLFPWSKNRKMTVAQQTATSSCSEGTEVIVRLEE